MLVLTGIDLLGIQGYVFASNRLKDVLSASWMVEFVTSRDFLARCGVSDERILLAAGGNAVVAFDDIGAAKKWTACYTRDLRETAPGIEAVVAHRSYEEGKLAWALKALRQIDLPRAKVERIPDAPQLGMSVTARCSLTGLPAVGAKGDELLALQILRLREREAEAKERWEEFLPKMKHAPNVRVKFPLEFDHMGRTHGDTSLLGIVHVDGNGVGEKMKRWLNDCPDGEVDDVCVKQQLRALSDGLVALGNDVLKALVQRVADCLHPEPREAAQKKEKGLVLRGTPDKLGFGLKYDKEEDALLLPVRPILLGGDDLTFVCDGRLALDLAASALDAFEKSEIPHVGEGGKKGVLTACAGVALVKAHAPFHQGYVLAEALCGSAKQARREHYKGRESKAGSWLDWHIGTIRPRESLEDIRARQYGQGQLTMRPYPLKRDQGRRESWAWLDEEVLGPGKGELKSGFRGMTCWLESRNRVKRLRAPLFEGREAVQRQVLAWKATDSEVAMPAKLSDDGFIGTRTALLDAIELMDLHIRLEPEQRVSSGSVDDAL